MGGRSSGLAITFLEMSDRVSVPRGTESELASVAHGYEPGRRKLAVKVVDIFGNDTMTIVEVTV